MYLERGQSLLRIERDLHHDGWWWCSDRWGHSGWVHESAFEEEDYRFIALEDFDTYELCARAGEMVQVLEVRGGRARCINAVGEVGWLPEEVLAQCAASQSEAGQPV